jgi:hypothetical protein
MEASCRAFLLSSFVFDMLTNLPWAVFFFFLCSSGLGDDFLTRYRRFTFQFGRAS